MRHKTKHAKVQTQSELPDQLLTKRLAGLRSLRLVPPLRDSRSGCPYPGLTPWAITISPLCGLGIFEVVSLLEGGALASPIRMARDAGAEFEC